jgi:hypothetical protein
MQNPALMKRVAAWTLVVLAVAFFDNAFRHTDDGCAVETHCLACRTASVPITPGVVTSAVATALKPTATVVVVPVALPRLVVVSVPDTRGPPPAQA